MNIYKKNAVAAALGVLAVSFLIAGCREINNPQTYRGYGYVDLGLPSGTKWAVSNIGGEEDELSADYYSWGESGTKTSYSKDTYKYASGYETVSGTINETDDVAHIKWGGKWRLPSKEEFAELEDTVHNTIWTFSPYEGRTSWIVKSRRNGRTIRLTALGYKNHERVEQDSIGFYLGATAGTHREGTFFCMGFSKDTVNMGEAGRYFGYTVRPVFK